MSDSRSDRDSVTEVAEESFVRERPLEIERGAVLAGRYQVEEVIGKGGSGVVLRVFDRTVQNVVALKVLKSELARDAKWDKRFSRELRLGRPIQHPNVCRIFDIGEADGHRFLTMELATGGSLRDELKRQPALERPIEDRLRDARAAIEGLAAIHAAGVVHRDFKPDNLLRMEDGRLVISDFGLATDAATAPGVTVLIGTPHYMAPEVLAGEPATTRSDVWALGVVLHEILFGRRPERKRVSFDGTERAKLAPARAQERPLIRLVEDCLEDDARDRLSDAPAVARRFKQIVNERAHPRRLTRGRVMAGLFIVAAASTWLFWSAPFSARRARRPVKSALPEGAPRVALKGTPRDWSRTARVVAEVPGHVHCFATIGEHAARIVWGEPRRAEDVDWTSGRRSPANLPEETFRLACPEVAPDGRRLLFAAPSDAGGAVIKIAESASAQTSAVVTSGNNPVWIDNQEFAYDIDSSHVAVFSLANHALALLADAKMAAAFAVGDKAVSPDGRSLAVLYTGSADRAIALFDLSTFKQPRVFEMSGASHLRFNPDGRELLVSVDLAAGSSSLVSTKMETGEAELVGKYSDFDLSFVRVVAGHDWLVARRMRSDAWTEGSGQLRRLTTDGRTYSATIRQSGDLLVSRHAESGRLNIWKISPAGDERQLTFGTVDVSPAFSPAGTRWAYADYAQRAIMLCDGFSNDSCRKLWSNEAVATGPSFSPDGRSLAIVSQLRVPRVSILSVSDGAVRSSWDSVRQCPPIWSEQGKVWSLEQSNSELRWLEYEDSGAKTGRSLPAGSPNAPGDPCWPPGISGPAAVAHTWTVRAEQSRLLEVRAERPGSPPGKPD
jgi:WD40 repeat protein